MTPKPEDLWRQIQEFPIDEGPVHLPFVRRLARENGWSESHGERVVAEYRKFLFLAMAAGHPVTPSDAVDQAWHLHLTYSKSYWDRLCGEVLRRPLHHHPTRGGASESRKYVDAYAQTLESYRRLFGAPPPPDLWPDPRLRFGRDLHFQRINTRDNIVLSRRRLRLAGLLVGFLAVGVLAVTFGEQVVATLADGLQKPGNDFLVFYWTAWGVALAAGWLFRRGLRKPDDEPRAEDLDLQAYEVAYLAAGKKGAVEAALAHLFREGKLRAHPFSGTLQADDALSEDAPVLYRTLHREARMPVAPAKLRWGASRAVKELAGRLRERGLVVSAGRTFLGTAVPLAMLALPGVLGFLKAVQGHDRGRPIGNLVLSLAFAGVAAGWMVVHRLRCSGRGLHVLRRLRESFSHRKTAPFDAVEPGAAWGVALFGASILSGTPWAGLQGVLRGTAVSSGSGRADGGGCGGCAGGDGGCGGGGCGGCGGCG